MKIEDLPQSYSDLVEALENILVGEILTGSRYFIEETQQSWQMFIQDLKFMLEIPKSASQYQPALVRLNTEKIKSNVSNTDDFEKEMKENGVVIIKNETTRNLGYVTMSGISDIKVASHWQFLFPDQSKFYNFYLVGKKNRVF